MSVEAKRASRPFEMKRLGMIMEPQAGNAHEVEGVLNPAAMRGPDGDLYLFPRLVGRGNYSRIGIARVLFNSAGEPKGVERLGVALEPEADYELSKNGGGCEPASSFPARTRSLGFPALTCSSSVIREHRSGRKLRIVAT